MLRHLDSSSSSKHGLLLKSCWNRHGPGPSAAGPHSDILVVVIALVMFGSYDAGHFRPLANLSGSVSTRLALHTAGGDPSCSREPRERVCKRVSCDSLSPLYEDTKSIQGWQPITERDASVRATEITALPVHGARAVQCQHLRVDPVAARAGASAGRTQRVRTPRRYSDSTEPANQSVLHS